MPPLIVTFEQQSAAYYNVYLRSQVNNDYDNLLLF